MARKRRIDTVAGQVELAARLQTKITSPHKLNKAQEKVFDEIIASLPNETWQAYSIRLVSNLAKYTVQIETLMDEIAEEGFVVEDENRMINNPKQSSLNQGLSAQASMMKLLGISASQRGISKSTTSATQAAEDEAKDAISRAKGSGGLLA